MSGHAADRNLLFGVIAYQMELVTRDQLVEGMGDWVLEKSRLLEDILVAKGYLAASDRELVARHMEQHAGNVPQSLKANPSVAAFQQSLSQIADPGVMQNPKSMDSTIIGASLPSTASLRECSEAGPVSNGHPGGTRFLALRPHAKGGLGEVFVALDTEFDREVALKEIQERHAHDRGSRSRFLMEAEVTGKLEHPGIVPVYGLGQYADGRPFYAMRFIRGDSLHHAIKKFHKDQSADNLYESVAFRKLLGRFIDVCNAIGYAHSQGILHRDLKPGNIMLGDYGETLVVDWGLAKVKGRDQSSSDAEATLQISSGSGTDQTLPGSAIGTPGYMSPEQAEGKLYSLGPATDIYGLGATLYTLLSGKRPIEAQTIHEALRRTIQGDVPKPSEVTSHIPKPLESICLKAMALSPRERYPSCEALAEDVERFLADEPVSAHAESLPVRAARIARKHRGVVRTVVAAALLLFVGALLFLQQQARQTAERHLRHARTETNLAAMVENVKGRLQELDNDVKDGGVFTLLNAKQDWKTRIDTVRALLEQARKLHAEAESEIDFELVQQLAALEKHLGQEEAEFTLAVRLEKIREDRSVIVEGNFNFAPALREYPQAFAEAGLDVEEGDPGDVAARIARSPIEKQLVAALDDWAYVAGVMEKRELLPRILQVARQADPDVVRDRLRDPGLWWDSVALAELADRLLEDSDKLDGLSPQTLTLAGHLLPAKMGERERWLGRAQPLHPGDFWLAFDLANAFQDSKNNVEAAATYRTALAVRPDCSATWNNLGNALGSQNKLDEAVEAYHKALEIDPQYVEAWNNLGVALRIQKKLDEALAACHKALEIDPQYANAWANLGNALRDQKKMDEAVDAYKKALEIDPQLAEAWNNFGVVLADQKKLDEGVDAYKKALEIDPEFAIAWANLGIALAGLTKLDEAVDAFKKALDIDLQFAGAWFNLGVALHNQKKLDEAVDAYRKALEIDPQDGITWANLGNALRDQKKMDEAVHAYHKALEIDPQYALTWNNLGNALRDQKKMDEAVRAYRKALEIDPQYAKAWNNLGLALRGQKKLNEAVDAYKKALKIDPQYVLAWNNLGIALRGQKKLDEAMAAYHKALEIDPQYVKAWNNLGVALRAQKKLDEAVDAYHKALEIDPQYALAWNNLGNALRDQKKLDEAVDAYKKALEIDPDPNMQYRYNAACAAALVAAGKGQDADSLTDNDRAELRQQSLDWLRADLTAYRQMQDAERAAAVTIRKRLKHWQQDPDLIGVRDAKSLAALSEPERQDWEKLWSDVAALLLP